MLNNWIDNNQGKTLLIVLLTVLFSEGIVESVL